ncbi:MAG: TIGR03915 family putative DNA repair protein [Pseudomonadota bacterium]
MERITLPAIGTARAFRDAARAQMGYGVPPEALLWSMGAADDLFAGGPPSNGGPARQARLPKGALGTINAALCHSDPARFARIYDVLWRVAGGDLRWADRSDPAMQRVLAQAKAVGRDIHKMHAFVRFQERPTDGARRLFSSWFEPDHFIVERAAPFFAKRFGDMDWVIATPSLTAQFVAEELTVFETVSRPPSGADATEDLWRTYYKSIFNPARLKVKAMQSEMPQKYWKNLPEADLIAGLIRQAETRSQQMVEAAPTEPSAQAKALARRRGGS